jgi:hypothetical protein
MCHLIEFRTDVTADLEVSPKQRLERPRIPSGTRVYAYVRPYVVETAAGPVEVADLHFDDGTIAPQIPFEWFRFAE